MKANIHSFAYIHSSRVGKSNGQDYIDPISCDSTIFLEDWVRNKDIHLEDPGASYWMAVDPPSANTMLLGPENDEAEDLGTGNLTLITM